MVRSVCRLQCLTEKQSKVAVVQIGHHESHNDLLYISSMHMALALSGSVNPVPLACRKQVKGLSVGFL